MRLWLWAMAFGLFSSFGGARADEDTDAARRLYVSATKHFDLTEYEAALNDFKEGFRRKDDAVFLYNIAQCYRLLNKNEEALRFYRTYLRREPNAPNREEVERRIVTLQESVSSNERSRSPQPATGPLSSVPKTPEPSPPRPETTNAAAASARPSIAKPAATHREAARSPVYKRWWFWTGAAVIVAAGVGVGLGVGLSGTTTERVLPPVRSMP